MKRILAVSDSHGNHVRLQKIIDLAGEFHCLVHCGDGAFDLAHVNIPPGIPVIKVAGNVDMMRIHDIERLEEFDFAGLKLMAVHGDHFDVRNGYDELRREGKKRKADIIFFGHTHIQFCDFEKPVVFNPGAANSGSYGIIEIEKKGRISCSHHHVE